MKILHFGSYSARLKSGSSMHQIRFCMKISITMVAILISGLQFLTANDSYSQGFDGETVTLDVKNTSIREVFAMVESQTGFRFAYNPDNIRSYKVSIEQNSIDLKELLDVIFQGTSMRYEVVNNKILVFNNIKRPAVRTAPRIIRNDIFETLQYRRPVRNVTGTVQDVNGAPLIGVNILVKGTNTGTTTDVEGQFSLNDVDDQAVLVVSYIGYESLEVPIEGRSSLVIIMQEDVTTLDEVVVVGYGVQRKSDVTGATVNVSAEEIASRPVNNVIEAMQGKAAGVDIASNERPGTVGNISVRGVRSLTASNSPLYVVDGIPLVTEVTSASGNNVTLGGIDNLNPSDIESIDILKDASATAIYGSRGANGVVLITTKQGKAGRMQLNFNSSIITENIHEFSPLMDAGEYINYRRWARYYIVGQSVYPRGDQPTFANDEAIFSGDPVALSNIEKGWEGGTWDPSKLTSTDWTDFVTRTGLTTQNTISASGGTEKMTAYGSFGLTDNRGVVQGQDFKRYNANLRIDLNPTEWFSFGGTLNGAYSLQEFGQSRAGNVGVSVRDGLYESARTIFTYTLPYDNEGNRVEYPGGDIAVKTIVGEAELSQDQRTMVRIFGSFYGQLDLGNIFPVLEGLKFRTNFGPDIQDWRDGIFLDATSVIRNGSSFGSLEKSQRFAYTLDNLLYYNKTVDVHDIGLTLVQSQTKFNSESSYISADNIPLASQKWNALGAVGSLRSWNSGIVESAILSYMARLNYSFNDKYLLTLSGRYDGASQLAEGNKWDFFPSAAFGWRLDQETFMDDADWIDQLKLRLGVGVTGNAAIDPYSTKGRLDAIFYPIGSVSVPGQLNVTTLANRELGWEKSTQFNVGLDFSFTNSRINGSLDAYTTFTTDLLVQRSIPSVTGFTDTYTNIGETRSNGVDLTLNTVNIANRDFEWSSTLNASFQDNEIVSLANGKFDDINNGWFIGQSQSVIYGYEAVGIWQESDASEIAKFNDNGHTFTKGNVRPVDQNGDGVIDANNDQVVIGSTIPKYILGLTNTFNFKDLELSIFLYGRMKYLYDTGGEGLVGRYNQRSVDYWTEIDPDSDYQKPIYSEGFGDEYYEALGYKDGSFLKIRNISLGYNLPARVATNLRISNLRLYIQAANPGFVFNKIPWIDMDVRYHASNRGFVGGINVQF